MGSLLVTILYSEIVYEEPVGVSRDSSKAPVGAPRRRVSFQGAGAGTAGQGRGRRAWTAAYEYLPYLLW